MLNHCGALTGCQPQHGPIYAHAAPHGSIHAPVALPHRTATESSMHLQPYLRVNSTPFTATRDDVIRAHGQPRSESRNTVGLTALDYGDVVYRFHDSGRLEEVTARAEVLHLGAVAVPFRDLAAFVQSSDSTAFDRAGFLVSPLYGIAFVPGEPCWVTALARHCVGEWEALRAS